MRIPCSKIRQTSWGGEAMQALLPAPAVPISEIKSFGPLTYHTKLATATGGSRSSSSRPSRKLSIPLPHPPRSGRLPIHRSKANARFIEPITA